MNIRKNLFNIIVIVIFIFLGAYSYFSTQENKRSLAQNYKYTIGYVVRHKYNVRTSQTLYYVFKYEDTEYNGVKNGSDLKELVGKDFIVKFNPKEPSNSEIILKYKVGKNIQIPYSGWAEIPHDLLN